jgi:L-ribulokinase
MYAIGIDYGTLSGRAVLVNLKNGAEVASAVHNYSHGVMDASLPEGAALPADWALQHPQDYLDVLRHTVPEVLRQAGVPAEQVAGVGIDFTACTVMPALKDGTPLCFLPQYRNQPHAYVKLWKHHAAQDEANRLNDIAQARGELFLRRYGGKISSEWLVPKLWQILNEAPEIYEAFDRFLEAADWVIWQLTGRETRNSCTAGYKAIWSKREGYPSPDFFKALHPRLEHVAEEKLSRAITPIGAKAGELTAQAAALCGLLPGTAVAAANVDAHVSAPAVGIVDPGKMLMIMGTSTCHIMLGAEERHVPGMCGVVEDGVIPGLFGYEAGQSCVGDHFEWLAARCAPAAYAAAAQAAGQDLHAYLTDLCAKTYPGESGLLALDWWNGNRSVLVDADLSGLLLGATLATKPEEIYRALIEATAFGTRTIIETFNKAGVPVSELYACGGIAEKNPFIMQVYADIAGMEIKISGSGQTPALGAALFGAVAAGLGQGGFGSLREAVAALAKLKPETYKPDPGRKAVYDRLFQEYTTLHDYFGRGGNPVMKRLKEIKKNAGKQSS